MAEQQVIELREKLENFQIEFDNYKAECKQLEQFLEEEALKKQDEVKVLKEDAIKKQKQLAMSKSQINYLQGEIQNLKRQLIEKDNTIKQLGQKAQKEAKGPKETIDPKIKQVQTEALEKLRLQLQESNKKVKLLESQKQQLQNQIQQYLSRHSQQVLELKQQIIQKDHKIKQVLQELQALNQANREKKNRTVEIKIEKTKSVPIPEQYSYLKEMCKMKQGEVQAAKQKIGKLMEKIVVYEKRIIELENQRSKSEQKQISDKIRKDQKEAYLHRTQYSDEEQVINPKLNLFKTSLSGFFVTKSYYKSPFLEIEVKNVIKLFKTDKNGRIDKSLGSTVYKLHNISFNQDQITVKTLENIYEDTKNGVNSRIVIYGTKKSNKRTIMCQIINRLKEYILNQLSCNAEDISECKGMGLRYIESQDDFYVKYQYYAEQKQEIVEFINNFGNLEKEKMEILKTSKRSQKSDHSLSQKKVRYFHYFLNEKSIEIITTSFTNTEVKQNDGLAVALDKIAYSKIPHFEDQKCRIHLIITLNPIVGLYQECKQTLKVVNCKKRVHSTSNIYDWRQSPARKILLASSRNHDRIEEQENQIESDRVFKLTQKIDFYRSKLSELMLKLKIILSTNGQVSYLKKPQAVLNYQKILKFIQTILNQGYIESSSPRKQFKTVTLQQLRQSP